MAQLDFIQYELEAEGDHVEISAIHEDRCVGSIMCTRKQTELHIEDIEVKDNLPARDIKWRRIRLLLGLPSPVVSYRRQGIGTQLLSKLLSWADDANFNVVSGEIAKVDSERAKLLLTWYAKYGFESLPPTELQSEVFLARIVRHRQE